VTGIGAFLDPHHLEVVSAGGKKTVKFAKAIIAAGSQAVKLPFLPEDPRIVDSTGALQLKSIPKRMLVIGGGIIGLEMATVYSTLGARIDVVEMLDGLMQEADRDLVKVWEKMNAQRFDKVMLKTKTVGAKPTEAGIEVRFECEQAPAEPQVYDLVLVAVGRSPNGKRIAAEKAGIAVTERGYIDVDKQMHTNVSHIFAIGDVIGQPMLAHKAVHEGHVAAEVAHGEKSYFDARQIPSVAYTDPEVAWAGKTEEQCKAEGIKFGKSVFPWAACGDPSHHRRWDRRDACRRPDQRNLPCDRDGLRAGGHWQDHSSASNTRGVHRHGRGGVRGSLHGSSAAEEEVAADIDCREGRK
jgi:dihydrolipoamide dehydrogenase